MNKNDLFLISILLVISVGALILFSLNQKDCETAKVYYEDKIILEIDLSINKTYIVDGYNGQVEIEVKNKKIRVIDEVSPLHLCSKQAYISKSYETIVCLPNKIIIKIEDEKKLDGVVG